MKKMTHMTLFEAFKSEKLSKTLNYIKPESRKTFMDILKRICNELDFPESELSDEYFQYLSFNKALNLNFNYEDSPCDARSQDVIERRYAVPGETCQKGLIKRKWGSGYRMVTCPLCGGSGLKKKSESPIKWLKFWFSKDGDYQTVTGTDGQIRDFGGSKSYIVASGGFSKNIDDYEKTQNLSASSLKSQQTGTLVWINTQGGEKGVGVVWKSRYNETYVIQDFSRGSEDGSDGWRRFGEKSWKIGSSSDFRSAYLIKPKNAPEKDDEIDPYTWNASFDIDYLSLKNVDIKSSLSNAHFALVLNFLDLRKSKFTTKSAIKGNRASSRTGATAFMTDEAIKSANIQRYLDTLAKNMKIDGIDNLDKNLTRMLGWNLSGIYLLRNRATSKLENLLGTIHNMMNTTDDSDKKYYLNSLVEIIKTTTQSNNDFNNTAQKSIKLISDWCKANKDDRKVEMWNKFLELNSVLTKKLRSFKVSSLEEMEVFYLKYKNLKDLARGGGRYNYLTHFVGRVPDKMENPENCLHHFQGISDYHVSDIIRDIERFTKVVEHI
jgi:hypothetical protein